jgi:hypothetical protein
MVGTQQIESLKLADGTTMDVPKLPNIDDSTWNDVKEYLHNKPDAAKNLQNFARNPEAIRGCFQTQAIAEHYNTKLVNGDTSVQERISDLKKDAELAPMFEDIEKNGLAAVLKYSNDVELMRKISRVMGGIPSELQPSLKALEETSLTLHEACKNGDVKAVEVHLSKQRPVDDRDFKGISPLGYAIGANKWRLRSCSLIVAPTHMLWTLPVTAACIMRRVTATKILWSIS